MLQFANLTDFLIKYLVFPASSSSSAASILYRRATAISQTPTMPRLARCALSLFVASSSSLSPAVVRRSARPFAVAFASPSSTSCRATATMAPEATLPRWDLSRFGFDSPFSDGIDSHLAETRKLAENFKAKYEGKLVSGWSLLHPVHFAIYC